MQNKPDINEVSTAISGIQFIEELGDGGFKVTYKANVNGNIEAVKLVRIPTDPKDPYLEIENRKRFRRELDILDRCESPYLVKLGNVKPQGFTINGFEYICYSEEFIDGESIRVQIQTGNRPSQSEIATVGICLLSAVEELWSMTKVHRDIKPGNVMESAEDDRQFILIDLGLAFNVGGSNYTRDSRVIPGTKFYLAPEFLKPNFRQSIDYRADLYMIGLTIYEYASGFNPFYDNFVSFWEIANRISHQIPPRLNTLRQDLDPSLCSIIDQLLKKLPALRPANISQLTRRLEVFK